MSIDKMIMRQCHTDVEWDAAKHFRQKYFFGPAGIDDPYTWTFNHLKHAHFLLYDADKIVGYVHIQLWPSARAAMRIIVIDEGKRNQHYGSQFLHLCEGWLRHLEIKSIHVESSPAAFVFYKKNGYVEMPFNDPDGYEGGAEDIAMGKQLCQTCALPHEKR